MGFNTLSLCLPQMLEDVTIALSLGTVVVVMEFPNLVLNVISRDLPGPRAACNQSNPCRMSQNFTGMCPVNEEDCAGAEGYKAVLKYWRRWDSCLDYAGCFEVIGVCTKDEFVS